MDQRATPQRFATRGQLRSRGNDVNVGGVIDDLVFGNRRGILILVPKETHALGNVESIEHLLVGHRSPSYRQIDRHQARSRVESVQPRAQQARIERESRQRFQMKITEIERGLVSRQVLLRRVRRDQYAWRIGNGPVQKPAGVAGTGDCQQNENLFHEALSNLRLVEKQLRCYFIAIPSVSRGIS